MTIKIRDWSALEEDKTHLVHNNINYGKHKYYKLTDDEETWGYRGMVRTEVTKWWIPIPGDECGD